METILHISDIHFGWEGDSLNGEADRKICLDGLLTEVSKLEKPWKPTMVCLSGDVGWQGTETDYREAKQWLDRLLSCCKLDYERLIICAGNHDAIRPQARKNARPATAKEADEVLAPPLAEQYLRPFSEFAVFCKSSGIPVMMFGDSEQYMVGERVFGDMRFVILNSAWFSKEQKEEGKLWLGLPHIKYLEAYGQLPIIQVGGNSPITIALAHHPREWLHADEQHASGSRPNTVDYLARRCHVLLTGHTHGEVRPADRIAEGAWHFTGGSAYAGASHFNSFRVLQIKSNQIVYRAFEFDPRSAENKWESLDAVSLPLLVEIPVGISSMPREKRATAIDFRPAVRSDAIRILERKSRLLRPTGPLPQNVQQLVSVRVSAQHESFDKHGRLIRQGSTEQAMPFYDAVREARRTLLLGDLGTGKSTLAAQLVVETIERSETAVACIVPVKSLHLEGQLTQRELLQAVDEYIANEVIPTSPEFRFSALLDQQIEVLLVFDGMDELSRDLANRLLHQIATLPEHWPTIQIVVTARPVELLGVSYSDWRIVHTVPLDETAKRQFLREELVADGFATDLLDEKITTLVQSLKDMPALDLMATSPLAIRLIYPRLSASADTSLTLGDLLYELLLERLGGWQKRDDKPHTFDHLEASLPTPEAKAEFLAILARKVSAGIRITIDEAKAVLEDAAVSIAGANKHGLSEEALACFEWIGLIVKGDSVEFPLQPLAEVTAAVGLLAQWRSQMGHRTLPDHAQWRVVSFAAAIARRRGQLIELRDTFLEFIGSLLCKAGNIPAACYIVVEASDTICAQRAVQAFSPLGHRPLTLFSDERHASARNVAKTLWLAGPTGFDWLFREYLDPKYPLPNAGSAIIENVFAEWAALALGRLSIEEKRHLAELVRPYLATGEGHFFGVLNVLAVMVPDAFDSEEDRFWYQSLALDSPLFGDWVAKRFLATGRSPETTALVNRLLLVRSRESVRAGLLWLQLNPTMEPSAGLIRQAFSRSLMKAARRSLAAQLVMECRGRLGEERWLRFARWFLASEESSVATGAAIMLYDSGERRLSILGDGVVSTMHDGVYASEAEKILTTLVKYEGDKGVRWLASRMTQNNELYGAHAGWWRVLLARVREMNDGPELLAQCVGSMGPVTLPRHPEVREAFSRTLNGSRGAQFRDALRTRLHSLDPKIRRGAAVILVATDPRMETDALFVAVRSRAKRAYFDWDEWENFCLTLDFAPSVLASLKSRLYLLESHSRTFALMLLIKGGFEIEATHRVELISTLLDIGNWHLVREPIGKSLLETEDSYRILLAQLDQPASETIERAVELLLDAHSSRLTPKAKAKCDALRTKPSGYAWDLSKVMIRIARDSAFAKDIAEACQEICDQGGSTPFLQLVLHANREPSAWKDVVWAMLCDDTRLGSNEADTSGQTLLEYGLVVEDHRKPIGLTAIECLSDPRVKKNRWADAYHWLAVIADEFVGITPVALREAIRHGRPIHCSAATALIARLGELPEDVTFDRGVRKRPASFSGSVNRDADADTLLQRLADYSRSSDDLHPALSDLIEESLFFPVLSTETLSEITSTGNPGILIATTLRFCYGLSPRLTEAIPLLDRMSMIQRNESNKPHVRQLLRVWKIVRESVLCDDKGATDEYLLALDRNLAEGSIWKLPLASEILRISGSLSNEQVRKVFLEYAGYATSMHMTLFEQLATWLAGDLDEIARDAVLGATHEALIVLNEAPWDSAEGLHPNTLAYLLFPAIQWALSGETPDFSEAVFLRGVGFVFDYVPKPQQQPTVEIAQLLSRLEPLLQKAPHYYLGATIRKGLDAPEPAVRAFCRLIQAFSGHLGVG